MYVIPVGWTSGILSREMISSSCSRGHVTLLSCTSSLCARESRIGKLVDSVLGVIDILEPLSFSLLDNGIEAVVLLLVDGDKFPIIVGIIIVVVGVPFRRGNDSDTDNTEAGLGLGLGGPSDSVNSVSGSEEEEEASLSLPVTETIVIG